MSSLAGAIASPGRPSSTGPTLRDQAGSLVRLLWIEIRRSQGIWLVPLMVGLGLFASINYSNDGVVFWEDLNNRTVMTYVVIGPLAAALAAWLAGRTRRQRLMGLVATLPGTGFRHDFLTWLTASCWGAIAYAIVFAWLGWQGFREATWGGPEPVLLLTGFLALALFAAIGVGIGRLVGSRFAPLLALIATFLLTIGSDAFKVSEGMGSYRQPLKLLLPWGLVSDGYPDVFFGSTTPYEREMVVWLVGVTGVVLAGLAVLRRPSTVAIVALAVSVVVAGVGAANLVRPGSEPWDGETGQPAPFEWSCRTEAGVDVCVHPAWNALLDDVGAQVAAMIGPLAGLDGVPLHWKQGHPGWADESGYAMLPQIGVDYVPWAVADAVFPVGEDGPGGPMAFRPASQLVILHWMLAESGDSADYVWPFGWPVEIPRSEAVAGDGFYRPPEPDETALAAIAPQIQAAVDRFAALHPAEQRAWLEANWDALRAGEITLDEMP